MRIAFHKLPGDPTLGVAFFWRLALTARRPLAVSDLFIPELFYDYVQVQRGRVEVAGCAPLAAAAPVLKTLQTRSLRLTLHAPLVVYGARCTLGFAERCWEPALPANTLLPQQWAARRVRDLPTFAAQVTAHLRARQTPKAPYPLLTPALAETSWLRAYSPRQKRRWYLSVFGLSRQALDRLAAVQAFLAQACQFDEAAPRLLHHLDPEIFYDQAHLNHAFKRVTGLAPRDYFQAGSLLQDNLMAASYNAPAAAAPTL
jgi:hypothetical protein